MKYLSDRQLFYKVVAKQRKFFEAFGLSVFDKLDGKYAALSNEDLHMSKEHRESGKQNCIDLAYNDGNLIEAHVRIQSLLRSLYLLQVPDHKIIAKVKSGARFKFLDSISDDLNPSDIFESIIKTGIAIEKCMLKKFMVSFAHSLRGGDCLTPHRCFRGL